MKATLEKSLVLILFFLGGLAPNASAQRVGMGRADPQYPQSMGQPVHNSVTDDPSPLDDSLQINENPFKPGHGVKASEIRCSIIEWENNAPKPLLTVVCPPPQVFAPLRVFLKFSWLDTKDVPKEAAKVVAEPRTETKIMLGKGDIKVFLKISKGGDDTGKEKWMAFNALQGFTIIPSKTANTPR